VSYSEESVRTHHLDISQFIFGSTRIVLQIKSQLQVSMVVDGTTFLRRAHRLFVELRANRYPNATTLAVACDCSKNTAQRTIYRLRDEYVVPLEYDATERGYFLKDKHFELPQILPPGKDELTALLLARELLSSLESEDIKIHLDNLWIQFAANNSSVARDLEPFVKVFSCDSTVIGDIADRGLLSYVSMAHAGESVRLNYKSPWRQGELKQHEGRILRVHFSDGNLYLLFAEKSGREFVLNTSFIRDFEVLNHHVTIAARSNAERRGSENWLDGFGIWSGDSLEEIEIQIRAPAAHYYAAQRWHIDQVDSWDGEILVRRFPGIVSPEVVRRALSLGSHLVNAKPAKLAQCILEDAAAIVGMLRKNLELAEVK